MNTAVTAMNALAHERRLEVFRRLVKAGTAGLAVGELVDATGLNFSTVSAQLLMLSNSHLVHKERRGRSIVYSANYQTMQDLITFLVEDCCQGDADVRIAPDAATCPKGACS